MISSYSRIALLSLGMQMGFRFDIDHANRIVRISFQGENSDQLLLSGYYALKNCWHEHGPANCIVDCTGVIGTTVSGSCIRAIANMHPIVSMDCLEIAVAPMDVTYGLARMFQILTSDSRSNVRVVRSMKEALKLIAVPSPRFTPMDDFPEVA